MPAVNFSLNSGRAAMLLIPLMLAISSCGPTPDAAAPEGASQTAVVPGGDWDSIKSLPQFPGGIWQPIRQDFGDRKFPEGITPNPYTFLTPVPKMTAEGQKLFDNVKYLSETGGDVPSRSRSCISGFGGSMSGPESQFEFFYSPGRVVILQSNGKYRRIYTDGTKLQDDPDLTLQGTSVGHWEGGTLVVDTNGLVTETEFLYGIPAGKNMIVNERTRLAEADMLEIVSSVSAEYLAQAYVRTGNFHRENALLVASDCIPRGDTDAQGNQVFNLTPPP